VRDLPIAFNAARLRCRCNDRAMTDFWVFGYGSLIWRPDFDYQQRARALLHGAHRRLCVFSHVHRGTVEKPGLVIGLDRGGSCHGVAYRIRDDLVEKTKAALRAREQVTMVYLERMRPVRLLDGSAATVNAICFLVDRQHPQYTGEISFKEQVELVRRGEGRSGPNVEYLSNTVAHMRELGIRDQRLEAIDDAVRGGQVMRS